MIIMCRAYLSELVGRLLASKRIEGFKNTRYMVSTYKSLQRL